MFGLSETQGKVGAYENRNQAGRPCIEKGNHYRKHRASIWQGNL